MYKPECYVKHNSYALLYANAVLQNNKKIIEDASNINILDVGCGPGNNTFQHILPLLPQTTERVIGIDLSTEHIEYARNHYQKDPRVSFQQLDITTDTLPNDYISTFDLVTSFHCLHYIADQKQAIKNIHAMIKPEGKLLLVFVQKFFNNMYQLLYSNPKWKIYMNNFKEQVEQSVQYYKDLFEEIGFEILDFEEIKGNVSLSKKEMFNLLTALNMFKVPEDLEKEFIQSQVDGLCKTGIAKVNDDEQKGLTIPFTMFVVTATKIKH